MKKKVALVLICSISLLLVGCSINKDKVINKYNDIIETFGKNALTKDNDLIGNRVLEENYNIGTYECNYNDFSYTEVLFGSCKVNRSKEKISLNYKVSVDKGKGKLVCKNNGEVKTINLFEGAGFESGEINITMYDGDFYIGFIGDHFSGSLNLISKEI